MHTEDRMLSRSAQATTHQAVTVPILCKKNLQLQSLISRPKARFAERADGLTEIVERDDTHEELAGAAFLIIAAFGGFVSLLVATWWTIF